VIVVPAAAGIINGVAFSPDGKLLAAACPNGWLKVWETAALVRSDEPLWQNQFDSRGTNHVQFSPDGKYLFACGDDGGAYAWNPAVGPPAERVPGPRRESRNAIVLVCSRDGKFVAWAGGCTNYACRIAVARVEPRKFHKQFDGHDRAIWRLIAAPDGLISGSEDHKIRFWDWTTGRMYHELKLRGVVRGLAASPAGDRLAASCGKIVYLWPLDYSDKARKRLPGKMRQLRGHTRAVSCLEFSTDGQTLASSGDDGTLRLWDAAAGTERRQFALGIGPLHWIAFAPDGLTLAVTSDKGHLVLLDLDD
jgi:WD40 repeat protein